MNLICLLEEPSAEYRLRTILPKLLPAGNTKISYQVFEGKQDLEKRLEKRMKGWQEPNSYFLVMRDQDSGDCKLIKKGLVEKVNASGKKAVTLIRIACHELESFYLGDLLAVETDLGIVNIAKKQHNSKYRNPDRLANASEELSKITKKQYQKCEGSRMIAPHLRLDGSNRSDSFNVLVSGIKALFNN